MSKRKIIVLLIIIIDIIIIAILGVYLLKKPKIKEVVHDVVFTFEDEKLKETSVEVNTETIEEVKVNLTINNETVSVKTDENGILYYACKSKIAGNNMLEICYGNQKWTRN